MKTAVISTNGAIKLDTETLSITRIREKAPSTLRNMYVADEDMHIIYDDGFRRYETDVKDGQLIAVFWRSITDRENTRPVAIFNSDDWKNNIDIVDADEQEQKEKWANEKLSCGDNCESKN